MKKKILPILVVFALIILIVAITGISSLIKKYTPSDEREDLSSYYRITSDDQVAIVLNGVLCDSYGKRIGEHVYVDFTFVHDQLNPRFYWDSNENILLYATSRDLIMAHADSNNYSVSKANMEYGRPIVKATATSAYVDLDFVKQYSDFTYTFFAEPNRIVLTSQWGEYTVASLKKDTSLRIKGGIKSPILSDVEEKQSVTVLEPNESWTKVMTEDGITGYVLSNKLTATETLERTSNFVPEAFSHITKDFNICMAWHQVFDRSANADVASVLATTKGVNVISPTWFYLNDNNGGIKDLGSTDYVNYCHSQGVEVWALVSNLENQEVSSTQVLTHTSSRQNLVNQIVSVAIQYNLDGINLDFEALNREDVGDAYIEFVRELSIKCANNEIVLSVDNYVPTSYTSFYNRTEQALFADYIVIMGYDEHTWGSEEVGSNASLPWVKQGVIDTLSEVPSNQVILGMPFYAAVWILTPEEGAGDNEDMDANIQYETSLKKCTMSSVNTLIKNHNATKQWRSDVGQNIAEFKSGGDLYQIWVEDADSMDARLKLLDEYQLAGAAFWKLGQETRDIWDTIIKYIN